jgi:hypothetical protein
MIVLKTHLKCEAPVLSPGLLLCLELELLDETRTIHEEYELLERTIPVDA